MCPRMYIEMCFLEETLVAARNGAVVAFFGFLLLVLLWGCSGGVGGDGGGGVGRVGVGVGIGVGDGRGRGRGRGGRWAFYEVG
jgi:hypothetical protein